MQEIRIPIEEMDFDPGKRYRRVGGDFRDPETGARAELGWDDLMGYLILRIAVKDDRSYAIDLRQIVAAALRHDQTRRIITKR